MKLGELNGLYATVPDPAYNDVCHVFVMAFQAGPAPRDYSVTYFVKDDKWRTLEYIPAICWPKIDEMRQALHGKYWP